MSLSVVNFWKKFVTSCEPVVLILTCAVLFGNFADVFGLHYEHIDVKNTDLKKPALITVIVGGNVFDFTPSQFLDHLP